MKCLVCCNSILLINILLHTFFHSQNYVISNDFVKYANKQKIKSQDSDETKKKEEFDEHLCFANVFFFLLNQLILFRRN